MNRLEWILGIILVVLLIAAAGLATMLWLRPQPTVPAGTHPDIAPFVDKVAPLPSTSGQTAKLAYVAAKEKTKEWQPDAILLSTTATWPQGAKPDYIKQGTSDWAFTFYSPSTNALARVTVVNGQPSLIPGSANDELQLLESSSWQVDSPDAVEKILTEGGKDFIDKEGITILTMTLVTNDPYENGRLEWLTSIISTQTGNAYSMRIDAASGDVIEIQDTSSLQ
jgi:hypothetical protein